MSVFVRSHLVARVAALAVSAIAVAPMVVSVPASPAPVVAPRVDLASSVKTLVIEPLSPEQIATAREVIERIDPEAQLRVQAAAVVAAAPLNAASDAIVAGYQFVQYWVDYGVQLADYVLGFIPYGYLIGDQINIVYFNLVRPISDSVVYDLIVPVVNDPLNLAAWVNGAVAVGQTVVNAAINTGIAEFNYFFGWLIPPLPPLPLAATQATTVKAAEVTVEPVAENRETSIADSVETTAPKDAEPASVETPEGETTETAAEPVTPKLEAEPVKKAESTTTTSAGSVEAQGEVRGGTAATEPTDAKPAEEKKPDGAKADEIAAENEKTAEKPAESSTDGDTSSDADAGKDSAAKDATKTDD